MFRRGTTSARNRRFSVNPLQLPISRASRSSVRGSALGLHTGQINTASRYSRPLYTAGIHATVNPIPPKIS